LKEKLRTIEERWRAEREGLLRKIKELEDVCRIKVAFHLNYTKIP